MTSSLSELGALVSLGAEQDESDAALLLEIFGSIEGWMARERKLRGASNKLYAYSFGAVWTDKRAGNRVGWRLGWSGVPWSAAARALLAVDETGHIVVRSATSRDPLTLEHVVPKGTIFARLRELSQDGASPADAVRYLHEYTRLAVVTKDEGKGLVAVSAPHPLAGRRTMRRSALPPAEYLAAVTAAGLPWQWARYLEVGIDLTSFATPAAASDLDPGVRALLPRS